MTRPRTVKEWQLFMYNDTSILPSAKPTALQLKNRITYLRKTAKSRKDASLAGLNLGTVGGLTEGIRRTFPIRRSV